VRSRNNRKKERKEKNKNEIQNKKAEITKLLSYYKITDSYGV